MKEMVDQDVPAPEEASATDAPRTEAGGPAEHRPDPDPPAGAADAQAEAERLQQELAAERDKFLRLAAEYQNYRRRTEREKSELLAYGQSTVVQQLLDVVDDFRRSLEAAEAVAAEEQAGKAYGALKDGVDLVFKKLMDELGKLGVEEIPAEGQPFDENLHEAMLQQPAPEGVAPGTVLQEFQRGYRLGDRVLRHSRVVVAA